MRLKDEGILAIGMISIALGILTGRFLHFEYLGFSITDFAEGVLVGLSLVMNLTYLFRMRKKWRSCSNGEKSIARTTSTQKI